MDEGKAESLRKEAKQILDKFSKALEGVKIGKKEFKKPAGGYRIEGEITKGNDDFKERMLENAPSKDDDCIIAEKKKW